MSRANLSLALACSLAVLLVAIPALPVQSHVSTSTAPGSQQLGHTGLPGGVDPLDALQFVGPAGTSIEDQPCASAMRYLGTNHIGHIIAVEGLNPQSGNWVKSGSTDFFHLDDGFANPSGWEGPYPGASGLMLGPDGFVRGQMEQPVVDGPGFDLKVHQFHAWASECVYGATSAAGPWFFVGTSFGNLPGCTGMPACHDLSLFYTPLVNEHYGTTGPQPLTQILLVASVDRYPYLEAHFRMDPNPTLYGRNVEFEDRSRSFGFAENAAISKASADASSTPFVSNSASVSGFPVTDIEMQRTGSDPIVEWTWYFDTHGGSQSNIASCGVHCFTAAASAAGQFPAARYYHQIGTFQVCLRIQTADGRLDSKCDDLTVYNNPVVGVADAFTVAEDSGANVLAVHANDSGVDAGEYGWNYVSAAPQHGTATVDHKGTTRLDDNVILYTPNANYNGPDSFSYFFYDSYSSSSATVSITVTDTEDPPQAFKDSATVYADSSDNVIDVLANDSDGVDEGETLTVASVTSPSHGTVSVGTDGLVRYTPTASYSGDDSFDYTLSDGAMTSSATVSITVVNPPPTASFAIEELRCPAGRYQFTSTSAEPFGNVVAWAWDFGDGKTGSGEVVEHRYRLPGVYDVTLSVTDDDGQTATATQTHASC